MFSIEQEISSYLLSEKLFFITQRDGVGSVQLHEITTFKKENFVADELPAAGICLAVSYDLNGATLWAAFWGE